MSEPLSHPRYAAHEVQCSLERAEAVVEALFAVWASVSALFTRRVPPATDEQSLTIHRAWLRASA